MVYNKSSKVRWRCARSSTRLTFTTSPESSLPYHSYYCFASIVEEAKAHILIARSVSRSILNYTSCMMIVPIIVLLTYIQTDFSIFAYVANWKKFTYNLRMYTNLYNIYMKLTIITFLQKFIKTCTLNESLMTVELKYRILNNTKRRRC